jgi:hypothetical protein
MSRSSSNLPAPTGGDFILYTAPDGAVKVDVFFKNETVWLTQKALAELFAVKVPAINKHLKNIFDSGELVEDSVISILETTAADSKNYQTRYYNLDAIIAVGYRVNSYQATQFRIWATADKLRGNLDTTLEEQFAESAKLEKSIRRNLEMVNKSL